ncbi:hypothetical protein NDU88_003808 [Pleurodeles waltl]|uniref:Uncharacterized protein n=1 Tax=Pleurodeles waltl TaxID=8319 RepID=A0AAV7L4Y4_PLEWA|nr:hypothetical protein NDU88_003808 [Pleurodeles waltl]
MTSVFSTEAARRAAGPGKRKKTVMRNKVGRKSRDINTNEGLLSAKKRRGETKLEEPANWTERRRSAKHDVEQEVEQDQNANTRRMKQERNVDLESTVQQEEKEKNTELREEAERTADVIELEETAKEWFKAKWRMLPEMPLPPATAQESCG